MIAIAKKANGVGAEDIRHLYAFLIKQQKFNNISASNVDARHGKEADNRKDWALTWKLNSDVDLDKYLQEWYNYQSIHGIDCAEVTIECCNNSIHASLIVQEVETMIKEVVKHKLQSLRIQHSGIKQTVNRIIRNIFFDTKYLTKKTLSEHLYKLTPLQTLFPGTKPVTTCTTQKQQIRIGYLNINGKARSRINNHYKKQFNLIHNHVPGDNSRCTTRRHSCHALVYHQQLPV